MKCKAVPFGNEHVPEDPDPKWVSRHIQQAQYSLQVVKCLDPDCWEPFVSDWLTVFPKRFIPPLAIYQYNKYCTTAIEPTECFTNPSKDEFSPLVCCLLLKKSPKSTDLYFPFEMYCPSMEGKLMKVSAVNVDIDIPVKLQ